jgi:hypothetical protein
LPLYYRRLLILDTQVKHLDEVSLQRLGQWLYQKWVKCWSKKNEAMDELAELGLSYDLLRKEWAAQVKEQTKLAPSAIFFILRFPDH